ncbi:MAG: hypothetical protein Q8Q91_00280 [Candidatus Daviesbacteria bacterium]|nr:hypothetical protein [Candidatus Daviesbacteria bacterium]
MIPLDKIKQYYPDAFGEELKKIQVFIYELCCGLMQYFHRNDWEKDIEEWDLKNKED